MQLIERPDDDLLIFELKIGNILLLDAIITYEDTDRGTYYIPLSDFVTAMEFPIRVDNESGTANGWSLNESEIFELSLSDATVINGSNTYALDYTHIEKHMDGIYVSLETIETWFPLAINADFSNLAIVVNSLQPLPIENRLARDNARRNLPSDDSEDEDIAKPSIRPDPPLFSLPFIDTNLQSQYANDASDADRSIGFQYSSTARNIVLGQDVLYTINDDIHDDESPDIRVTIGRQAFDGETLPGGLTEYAVGDVVTNEIPLIARSNAGRGLFFTNQTNDTETLSGSDTITLRGELPVGFQIDIKRNGELLDFLEEPDENGEYVFEDLFVFPGLNVFELVFYGPQGQERVEERRIFVADSPVTKGQLSYRVNAISDNTNLFNNRSNVDDDTGELRATGEIQYGLSDISSLSAAAASYSLDGTRETYGLLGFRTSLLGARFDISHARNSEGSGSSARLESIFKGFRWQIQHEYFNDFETEENAISNLSGNLEHESNIRLSGILPFGVLNKVPLTLEASRLQNEDGDTLYDTQLRATTNINNIRLTTRYDQIISSESNSISDLNFQVSSRFDNIRLRGTARYSLQPQRALQSINLTSDIQLDDLTQLRLGGSRSGADDPIHDITLGLNRDFGFAKIGLNSTYEQGGAFIATLGASFGLAYGPISKRPYVSSQRLSESSGLIAAVFEDKNLDYEKNDDEDYLENVDFNVRGSRKTFTTNDSGKVFIPVLDSYDTSSVSLDPDSFPNPFMTPKENATSFQMRPSQIGTYEFGLTTLTEVDGSIFIVSPEAQKPATSIQLDVIGQDSKIIASAKSEFDGFFFIQNIPAGSYMVRPNIEQLDRLGYCATKTHPVTVSADEPFYSVPEPFLLYPKPEVLENSQWLGIEILSCEDYRNLLTGSIGNQP